MTMEQACIEASKKIDKAILGLHRRQYEDDLKQVAHWRAVALVRLNEGLNINFPLRRARYYLAQARNERHKINSNLS